jgi:hypothetical protein
MAGIVAAAGTATIIIVVAMFGLAIGAIIVLIRLK